MKNTSILIEILVIMYYLENIMSHWNKDTIFPVHIFTIFKNLSTDIQYIS